jgi:hypothetical protein
MSVWPANSCDLNPIEHLWGALKRLLSLCVFKSEGDFHRAVASYWNSIPQEAIDRLVLSFRVRLIGVLVKSGASISDELRSDLLFFEKVAIPEHDAVIKYASWYDPIDKTVEDLPNVSDWRKEEDLLLIRRYLRQAPSWKTKAAKELKRKAQECSKRVATAVFLHFREILECPQILED